ncbi:MAG: transcription antitermination factor NusB [Acidobacteriota bacterium]
MPNLSPARKAAFQILLKIEGGAAHSDELLRGAAVSALAPVDRNLATALVLGVLRSQLQLDAALRPLLARPGARLDAEVRIALLLGAFQLLHMDRIPPRAAIDESVELTKQSGHRFASGMVNAVLRKLAASDPTPTAPSDAHAYPAWLTERWTKQFGADAACAICRHGQQQPALTLRLLDSLAAAELTRAGIQLEPGELLSAARTVLTGDVAATPAFQEGRIRIQDEGSQLVAEIAAFAGARADSVLDACAAPGGKTLILAERLPQARIVACEASEPRYAALRERLAPLGNRIESRHADASALTDTSAYSLVLADVPCSGTGTLGRNPEIRHRLAPEDFARQADRQKAILSAAIGALRPGGRAVYSTCSLEPEENENVVAAIRAEHAPLHVIPIGPVLAGMESAGILVPGAAQRLHSAVTSNACLRLMPGAFGTDGFFVSILERAAP